MVTAATTRRAVVFAAAQPYGGVLSRTLLAGLGADRNVVRREIAAGRWRLVARRCVAVHLGPLDDLARRWVAIWEVGAGIAVLDGVTALQSAGLKGVTETLIDVSVPRDCPRSRLDGIRITRVQRLPGEILDNGIPRVRPALAAVRAAHWARSDRQAALFLAMPVQQHIITGTQLIAAARLFPGRTRRALVARLVADIADGAQSLGELDFASMCRARGLPSPSRQVVVAAPSGRVYLDARWDEVGLVVEVDGSGHQAGLAVMADNLRQNTLVLRGDVVLRIDLVGIRLAPDQFMDQVCAAYTQRNTLAS